MNKKFVLLFLTSIFILQSNIANNPITQKYTPQTAVIAWDLHDVLVEKNWWSMFEQMGSIISSSSNRWQLLKIIPSILYDAYQVKGVCSSSEELIDTFIKKYPQLALHRKELLLLINQHEPIKESIKVLEQFKKDGYRNFLASNIGYDSFELIKKKYPELFNLFDGYYIPHTQRENGNHYLIAKPCIEYFHELRIYLATKGVSEQTTIIFIDDNQSNINAADNGNLDIIGIHFTSPEQLKAQLEQMIVIKGAQ